MTWTVVDLETENKEYCGSLASPHCPDNYIVAPAWAHDNGEVHQRYFTNREEADADDWLEHALAGQKVLVAHNATFELHWLLSRHKETLLKFLANGGRVFCTQYAEFLLSHQLDLYPRLEDCSLKYGGTAKVDVVKIMWEQGKLTSEIPKDILQEYLQGDIENTRLVCFAQVAALKEQGMLDMFWMRMQSLVFNAIATFNGLYVDREVAKKNQAEQEKQILVLKDKIKQFLPEDFPEDFPFSFTSDYHLSAFLFGGTINYPAKVSYEPKKYVKYEAYKVQDKYVPIAEGVPEGCEVWKSGKNKGQPKIYKVDSSTELLKWGTLQYTFKGLLDVGLLPPMVHKEFFGKGAQFVGKRFLPCGTPVYSTSKEALAILQPYSGVARELAELAALEKDTGTYYLREEYDKDGNIKKVSGMLQYVEPDGIIHHRLNNCATVTGRLSGTSPNLQNVPRDGTSRVKEMFTSRFPEGRIVEVDYSALEVVAMAAISGDKNLLKQLQEGTDMHCYRLAGALGEDYESVYEKCHNQVHPEHKKYKQMRTDIKPRAFANQYGASASGIAFSTGCSLEEAEKFKETERKLFPESSTFAERIIRPAVEETGFGSVHREQNPETGAWVIYHRGYFRAKGGTCYSFREFPKKVDGKQVMDYKDTQIANYWCQGEASFIVQTACGRFIQEWIKAGADSTGVLPINTVHDAIYLDCSSEDLAIEWGKKLQKIMEETPKFMAEQIPAYKDWGYHEVPFPAAAEYGLNMLEKKHIN